MSGLLCFWLSLSVLLESEFVFRRCSDLVGAEEFYGGLLKKRGWKGDWLRGSVLRDT